MKKILLSMLSLAILGLTSQSLQAQIVPFYSIGFANEYNPSNAKFEGPGITAHMGASSGSGLAIPLPSATPGVLDWSGGGKFVAANGDSICFVGGGKVYLSSYPEFGPGWFTAEWRGEFNITGGTGRFFNVGPGTAPLSILAVNDPFQLDESGMPVPNAIWTYDYEITGDMDLGRRAN